METVKEKSKSKILSRGYLWINVPALVILLVTIKLLFEFSTLERNVAIIIGGIVAWIYWEFAVLRWIKWALTTQNINGSELLKLAQPSLLLWNDNKIKKVQARIAQTRS